METHTHTYTDSGKSMPLNWFQWMNNGQMAKEMRSLYIADAASWREENCILWRLIWLFYWHASIITRLFSHREFLMVIFFAPRWQVKRDDCERKSVSNDILLGYWERLEGWRISRRSPDKLPTWSKAPTLGCLFSVFRGFNSKTMNRIEQFEYHCHDHDIFLAFRAHFIGK